MTGSKRPLHLLKDLTLTVAIAVAGTALMAYLDAVDWFYHYSRRYEDYDFDEVVVFLFLFLCIGMLVLVFRLYRRAVFEGIAGEDPLPHQPREDLPGLFAVLNKLSLPLPKAYKSPLLLVISLSGVIALAELLDMMLLGFLPELPIFVEALIDAAILIVMISPALFYILFRPLARQFIVREQTEKKLQQCNLDLENRVDQRTSQLQAELLERKKAEELLLEQRQHLHALSSELARVTDREKHRIATDLHDNIGQSLAMAKNKLGILQPSIAGDQNLELFEDIKALIESSIRYSRNLIFELSSPLLDYLSFASALEWLAEEILQKNRIAVRLKIDDSQINMADESRALLLKAIRELLINIVKHAKARKVEISVRTDTDVTLITIRDDGTGFDAAANLTTSGKRVGLGLFSVRERLDQLGGSFALASTPGEGTCITLRVPIRREEEEESHEH